MLRNSINEASEDPRAQLYSTIPYRERSKFLAHVCAETPLPEFLRIPCTEAHLVEFLRILVRSDTPPTLIGNEIYGAKLHYRSF